MAYDSLNRLSKAPSHMPLKWKWQFTLYTAHSGVRIGKIFKFFYYDFGFEGTILVSLGRKKKYFPIWSTMNIEKISGKLEKMAFYVVILTMFQFSVFSSILLKSAYILKYLDIKGIIFHFNHSPELSQFLRNEWPSVRFFDLWISISWSIWGQS